MKRITLILSRHARFFHKVGARPTAFGRLSRLEGSHSDGFSARLVRPWRHVCLATSRSLASSPFDPENNISSLKPRKRHRKRFVPKKAAVALTEQARIFFRRLLEKPPRPDIIGVALFYDQASSGQPRMVFRFGFVTKDELHPNDEGVSLEVLGDSTPKPPAESENDGLPKLYVHHNAFLKVLGATVDVNTETIEPILYDREGNEMDPNA